MLPLMPMCCVLAGDHDTVASPAKLLGLASAMSSRGVSVAVLEQCGHMAQEEAPASLLHQLALFVQQVQSFGGA
jgi:pimeloyl-ACP methyl ester carboxylesterase